MKKAYYCALANVAKLHVSHTVLIRLKGGQFEGVSEIETLVVLSPDSQGVFMYIKCEWGPS